jgi:RNA polymerase sigma-70 factor (ECF subfamily)
VTSDEALMLDYQRGSRDAFEELFERYRGPLSGFFRRRILRQERAEDLVQETFLAVIRATSRYEPRSLVRTYLYGIALKLLAEERRRQAKDAPVPESSPEPVAEDAPETVLWVRQAVDKLDSIDREVLMLREYEQLSYSEIAHLLRLPMNTVRSRLFRARMALKDCLEPEASSRNSVAQRKSAEADKRQANRLQTSEEGVSQ